MRVWSERSPEERALLGPSFSSILLWHAAVGHQNESGRGLPFEEAFLVLPIVLHQKTRNSLPKIVTSSLAVWVDQHPLSRTQMADRAQTLVPFTKEALFFGGRYGLFTIDAGAIEAVANRKGSITKGLKDTSEEVRSCMNKAVFLGRWFAKTGTAGTVMAIMGVRP